MSLHFILRANGQTLGMCAIQCLHSDRGQQPDAVYDYSVLVDHYGPPPSRYTSVVQHRYGDGPWTLVAKALEHAAELHAGGRRA